MNRVRLTQVVAEVEAILRQIPELIK
jgi:hypothetical protein